MIMEAGIFQDLQGELASWRRKKSWCFNSSPKARKMGSVPVKSSSDRNNDLFLGGRSAFWFFPGFQLIGWDPPTLGRLTCFTQPPDWNVCFMRYTLTKVPGVRLDHRAGYQAAQSTWHIKLTIIAHMFKRSMKSWQKTLMHTSETCLLVGFTVGCFDMNQVVQLMLKKWNN